MGIIQKIRLNLKNRPFIHPSFKMSSDIAAPTASATAQVCENPPSGFERVFVAVNRWILIGLLLTMAALIFANVMLRYTTGESIVWAEEVARHMMIALTFLGMGQVLRFGGHVAVDNLAQSLSSRAARILRGGIVLTLLVFALGMVWSSSEYVWRTRFQTTAATDIPIAFVYAVMPVGFLCMALHLIFVARRYMQTGEYLRNADEAESGNATTY